MTAVKPNGTDYSNQDRLILQVSPDVTRSRCGLKSKNCSHNANSNNIFECSQKVTQNSTTPSSTVFVKSNDNGGLQAASLPKGINKGINKGIKSKSKNVAVVNKVEVPLAQKNQVDGVPQITMSDEDNDYKENETEKASTQLAVGAHHNITSDSFKKKKQHADKITGFRQKKTQKGERQEEQNLTSQERQISATDSTESNQYCSPANDVGGHLRRQSRLNDAMQTKARNLLSRLRIGRSQTNVSTSSAKVPKFRTELNSSALSPKGGVGVQ